MPRIRDTIAFASVAALFIALACLVRVYLQHFGLERILVVPLLVVSLGAFTYALYVEDKIARFVGGRRIHVLRWLVGWYHATLNAPMWVVVMSLTSLVATSIFGKSGRLNDLPETPEQAQLAFAVIVGFLALSLPTLWTKHQAAP